MTVTPTRPSASEPAGERAGERPRLGDAGYNLAANVYGEDDAPRRPTRQRSYRYQDTSSSNGQAVDHQESRADAASERPEVFNLARRVYGGPTAAHAADLATQRVAHANGASGNGAVAAVTLVPAPAKGPAATPAPISQVSRRRFSIRTFESLSVVPFRWFLLAMLGQFSAMNMQMLARGYLVFELTGSFAALGLMSLANAIPMFIFSPGGGVLADRVSRKLILQIGQGLNAGIAGAIAVLLFLGILRFEHLLASAALQGVVWALMMPARQAMIPDVVGEDRLMNGVALNTAGMNVMRLAAPGIGGVVIAAFGAEWAYVFMASAFAFAVVALWPVPQTQRRLSATARPGSGQRGAAGQGLQDLSEAVRYIAANRTVMAVLIVNFAVVLFSMPYMMLLPGFVADVLDGGADQLGLLMTITGAGSVVGSLAIASMPNRRRGLMLILSSVLLGFALIAFSISTSFTVTALLMVIVGLGQAGRMSLSNVLLQAYVENEYRGRVMSVYMMEFSVVSFGVFAVGILASVIGVQWAIGGTAVALTVTSLAALLYPRLRRLD